MADNNSSGSGASKNGKASEFDTEALSRASVLASRYITEGKYELAIEQCQSLVRMASEDWKSHYTLAYCLNKTGDFRSAKLQAAIAAEQAPEEYIAQSLYAELCITEGDWDSCEQVGGILARLDEHNLATHKTLGLIAEHKGDILSAEAHFAKIVENNPAKIDNILEMGAFYNRCGKSGKALLLFAGALERYPQSHEILNNMGNCFMEVKSFEKARDCYLHAIAIKPEVMYFINVGLACHNLGEFGKALEMYRQGLLIQPDSAGVHYNMSLTLLTLGRFEQGWAEYEWRWKASVMPPRDLGSLRRFGLSSWEQGLHNGVRALIWQEQGLGDAIQFIRYVPYLQKAGLIVDVFCDEGLRRLFRAVEGGNRIISDEAEIKDCDYDIMIPMLSIPLALGNYQISNNVNYIQIDEELAQSYKRFFNSNDKIKVGLIWGGNPKHRNDRFRSFHIDKARELFDLERIEFYSLQKGKYGEELRDGTLPIIDLSPYINDFLDSAALMKNLDLVISVDTAPLHLAGAIGVPVWGLIPRAADWRWMQDCEATPWYPSMKIYRNTVEGEWGDVFRRIRMDLMRFNGKENVRSYAS
jgi:tetratricopeptide (TPR) repeat protein